MATRYVSATTARVTDVRYVDSGEPSPDLILIYGDEVESDGDGGASVTVTFRGRRGSVKAGALAESPVLEVYFIDVGQGDSTFIVTPQRRRSSSTAASTARRWGSSPGSTGSTSPVPTSTST